MGSTQDSPKADVGLVLVHGIGAQLRGATLVEWAEPLARRLDFIARTVGGEARVTRSVLGASAPVEVHIEVQRPNHSSRRIVITEARWAEEFVTEGSSPVLLWAAKFSFRAAWRAAEHFIRFGLAMKTSVIAGTISLTNAQKAREFTSGLAQVLLKIPLTLAILGLLPIILTVVVVGLVVLTILSRIPFISSRVNPIIQALTTSIGDASTWTRRPVNAAAIRDVVRDEILRANNLARKVIVLGHSQGAAVSVEAILAPDADTSAKVDTLITVGGAVLLLRSPRWSTREAGSQFSPISAWSSRENLHWINIWAMWDPVSSGPITERPKDAKYRWSECYRHAIESRLHQAALKRTYAAILKRRPKRRHHDAPGDDQLLIQGGDFPLPWTRIAATVPECPGPEEWPVHNQSSLIRDHITYPENILQVIDPLAYQLLGEPRPSEGLPGSGQPKSDREQYQDLVRSFGLFRVIVLVFSVLHSPITAQFLFSRVQLNLLPEAARAVNEGAGSFFDWVFRAGLGDAMKLSIAAFLSYLAIIWLGSLLWRGAIYLTTWDPLSPRSNNMLMGCRVLQVLLSFELVGQSVAVINLYLVNVFPIAVNLALSLVYGLLPLLAALPWRGARPSPIPARRSFR
jgi:hypothetical protein